MSKSFFTHPAIGLTETQNLKSPLPLTESDLPFQWNHLDDDRQESAFRFWWRSITRWLDGCGADSFDVEVLESADRRLLESEPAIATLGRGCYGGPWNSHSAELVGQLLSPQRLNIFAGSRTLLQLTGTWDGVTVHCDPEVDCERLRALLGVPPSPDAD